MPQPLSQVRSNVKSITWSPEALNDKPELALIITSIIAMSSNVDHELGMVLGIAALAIYGKLESQTLQRAALSAAAQAALSNEDYMIFQAVISTAESAQAERHRLAHWIWGICEDLPDALLLMDPKYWKEKRSKMEAMHRNSKHIPLAIDEATSQDIYIIDQSKVFVYRIGDLQRAKRDLVEVANILFFYHLYLSPPITADEARQRAYPHDGIGTSVGALRELSKIRLYREALDRLKGKAERNTPQVPS